MVFRLIQLAIGLAGVGSALAYVFAPPSDVGAIHYAGGAEDARRLLLGACFPSFVFGSQAPDCRAEASGPSQVAWIARQRGVEIFRYVATLHETGAGKTRVTLDLKGSETGGPNSAASRLAANPSARNLYLVAMREQISATFEKRDYEMTRIYPALAAASVANMGTLRASADQVAENENRRAREAIRRAYEDERAGKR